jgi:LysR family hydrogen peroxide-inducible transcriptional activator
MTLQQLEYVLALGRYRHFAKAADACKVTQPTLSAMIQKLEEELGVKLFDRRRQPIVPTQAGKAVIAHAQDVLFETRRLRDAVKEEQRSLTGTFTVGVLPTIAPYLLPRFFPQLLNDHKEMDVRIIEMKTGVMKRALADQTIDAGILARVDGLDSLELTTLYYEQFYVYVSERDPLFALKTVKTTDLSNDFLWLLDEGHCFSDQLVRFCNLGSASRSQKTYRLGSIETFMRMVEHDKGVTFIPELAVHQLTDQQRRLVRPFALPIPTREIVMAVSDNFIRRSLLNFLVEQIQASVPKEMLRPLPTARIVL